MLPFPTKSLFIVVFVLCVRCSYACKGCVSLDDFNFEKIITRFPVVLVKFDVAYPYGEQHELYSKLSEETSSIKDLLFAEVGVKDYGEKENENLAKSYGITKENYPAIRLFKRDLKNPVEFPKKERFTLDDLRTFIRDNTDIYIGLPGCLEKFDKLAAKFSSSDKKDEVLKEAENLSNKLADEEKSSAKTYILMMKKTIETGKAFLSQEFERVSKLLEGKVSSKKKQELQSKLNIIRAFTVPRKDEL